MRNEIAADKILIHRLLNNRPEIAIRYFEAILVFCNKFVKKFWVHYTSSCILGSKAMFLTIDGDINGCEKTAIFRLFVMHVLPHQEFNLIQLGFHWMERKYYL